MKSVWLILPLLLLFACFEASCQNLEQNFKNPPTTVRPRTWMHAMSGNMSKAGMTIDLEAIAAAGEGGILLFNVANGIPYGEVKYGSEEHHSIIKHTAKECERLGLSFGVHNCDGWSSSGGPWIKPEESMKMVVWSKTVIDGGSDVRVQLAQPTTIEGFYKDIAVIAYPTLRSELIDAEAKPVISCSNQDFSIKIATNNSDAESSLLTKKSDENSWILYDFGRDESISSIYVSHFQRNVKGLIEISNDGNNFQKAMPLENNVRIGKNRTVLNHQFDPITARFFRISFESDIEIAEIKLQATRPYNHYLHYSGMSKLGEHVDEIRIPKQDLIIHKESIIDLSSALLEDGTLKGKLPDGKWTVMRFGYTSTGARNWPASKWGIGLECDKFSRSAFKVHFDAFAKRVIDNTKRIAPNALQYIEIDSYEMGGQNWTDGFEAIFKKEKGYDIIPFLPLFAGRYVESAETVTGIVYDLNEMYCNLMTNNYFKYFTELCNENGLKSYVEPYGNGPVSTLDVSAHIDLPMDEFWMNRSQNLSSTVMGAHIYGKNIVSAESFTSRPELNWKGHPAMSKRSGDLAWTNGINEFMFHRFAHQANIHVKPGLTMGQWGSHFDRTQTWWMNAGVSWFDYIARGSYLLRQGYPVADVLVFVGDGSHRSAIRRDHLNPQIPQGISFDCTNADVLKNRIALKDKTMVLPEGNAYGYLLLQDIEVIALPTLRRIKQIVDAGVPVIGNKPEKLAGYNLNDRDRKEFESLCSYIWSQANCTATFDFTKVQPDFQVIGNEKPFVHRKSEEADIYFFYNEKDAPEHIECAFRVANKIPELWNASTGEITKLANFKNEGEITKVNLNLNVAESAFIVFRESAENVNAIFSPDAGKQLYFNKDKTVTVETDSEKAFSLTWNNGDVSEISANKFPERIDLSTQWNVEFLKEHNFASKSEFPVLSDWKDSEEEDIKYYSGTAIYTKSFSMAKKKMKNLRYLLDLGEVDIVAEVFVNGHNAGVLWIAPFVVDITDYLQKGNNHLEIEITNQWANRLIGDENYPKQDGGYKPSSYIPADDSKMPDWYINNEPMPQGPRVTFSSWEFYSKGDELMPSGLKGPVSLKYKRVIAITQK